MAAVARMYEEMGWLEQAADLYEASMEQGLPEPFYLKTIDRYALLRRKQGEWDKAVLLWQKAAEHGQYLPCIELAKYYEHHDRNYREALAWTQRALALLDKFFTYESTRRPVEIELLQRIQRINRKLSSE
jgi:TPR repeat protein